MSSIVLQNRIIEHSIPVSESGCWIWEKGCNSQGYGALYVNKKMNLAHRISYEIFIGLIPDGLLVCHKCDIKVCVNPNHLFIGTQKDNMQDHVKKGKHISGMALKTHCKLGHELFGNNLHFNKNDKHPQRYCRKCLQIRENKYKQKRENKCLQ